MREFGRESERFDLSVSSVGRPTVDTVRRYEEAGVAVLRGQFWTTTPGAPLQDIFDGMSRFADEVLQRV